MNALLSSCSSHPASYTHGLQAPIRPLDLLTRDDLTRNFLLDGLMQFAVWLLVEWDCGNIGVVDLWCCYLNQ